MEIVWLGVVKDIPKTGEHLVVVPLVSEADKDFEVFVSAKIEGKSLAEIAKPGQKIILMGTITGLGTSGPLVTASRFALEQPKQ